MERHETLRLKSLELAVQHLSEDAHNLETVLQWADKFYEWLTQDGEASEDMVSKTELKEKLQPLRNYYKGSLTAATTHVAGYIAAISDVERIIDEL